MLIRYVDKFYILFDFKIFLVHKNQCVMIVMTLHLSVSCTSDMGAYICTLSCRVFVVLLYLMLCKQQLSFNV